MAVVSAVEAKEDVDCFVVRNDAVKRVFCHEAAGEIDWIVFWLWWSLDGACLMFVCKGNV